MHLSLLNLVYVVHVQPFQNRGNNSLEIFNEICGLIVIYHFLIFNEFNDNATLEYNLGWAIVFIVLFDILTNTFVIAIQTLLRVKDIIWKKCQAKTIIYSQKSGTAVQENNSATLFGQGQNNMKKQQDNVNNLGTENALIDLNQILTNDIALMNQPLHNNIRKKRKRLSFNQKNKNLSKKKKSELNQMIIQQIPDQVLTKKDDQLKIQQKFKDQKLERLFDIHSIQLEQEQKPSQQIQNDILPSNHQNQDKIDKLVIANHQLQKKSDHKKSKNSNRFRNVVPLMQLQLSKYNSQNKAVKYRQAKQDSYEQIQTICTENYLKGNGN
ncbi:UNKNOWN [Stylonychia lemnae]|uniref:Transmembrane protein n=1 Tax=Stylonychia lemnae TaxID=5949 RepID=A0A078B5V8_STYLE|nr:UNKNOWN [Stylonychia lemnae]|eukprot:CDW89611.1 UNKNOWN [Stylonychia lemnae]